MRFNYFMRERTEYLCRKFETMKKIVLLSSFVCLLLACKKENATTYKVKYSVTGNAVNQYKITVGSTDNFVETPFTGTKDTTIYISSGTVKLDAKADGGMTLVGSISINDLPVATGSDDDIDGDNKTQVKLEYTISQQ